MEVAASQSHAFQADVSRLLDLMVHSVYSERDIFLRELVSNGADACEKLRYEALADPGLLGDDSAFLITVVLDKEAKTLTVADNGIGMSQEDLTEALGTIARSGTRAFLTGESGGEGRRAAGKDLIGQFGIGFYSAFMVADRIDVETRRAGSASSLSLEFRRQRRLFDRAAGARRGAGARHARHPASQGGGRRISRARPRSSDILREHSSAIAVPIALVEAPGQEPRRLTEGSALWTKPKSAITDAGIYRILPRPFRPVRRAGADAALARRGPA